MLDDLYLINQIKENNDSNSFNELINRHTGIYNTMVYKYLHTNNSGDYHDLIENREYNFYSFIKDYDSSKNMKFSTFVGDRTKYLCLSKNQEVTKVAYLELEDNTISDLEEPDNNLINKDSHSILLKTINEIKNSRFKDIMTLRFLSSNKVLTWREVADKIGVTPQCVHKTYQDNIDQFKKTFLTNLDLKKV